MEIHSIPGVRCQVLAGLSEHNGGSAPIETQTAAHTLGMDRRKLGGKATPGDAQPPGDWECRRGSCCALAASSKGSGAV